jgi:hypothetical protein
MNSQSVYEFALDDISEVIKFCRDYHLDVTKQASGRTGAGPRGLGGEIDAFGPGKLNEVGISKLISTDQEKICMVDNQIYSNHEVGIKTIPDIVAVKEKNNLRKPNLYIEIKKIAESDQWLGIHTDQLKSIMRDSKINQNEIYLIYGQVYFQDKNNRKQQDFLGSFLNSIIGNSPVQFNEFSSLKDLKCRIHYILSVSDLQKYGHEFEEGDIIPELDFDQAKQVFRNDGRLWKGLKIKNEFSGVNKLKAIGINGETYEYGKFEVSGKVQIISSGNKSRQYLNFLEDTTIENEYFGRLEFRKGQVIFFNIKNMLAGLQGSKVKTKSDWWISRKKLDQLITNQKIQGTENMIKEIRARV